MSHKVRLTKRYNIMRRLKEARTFVIVGGFLVAGVATPFVRAATCSTVSECSQQEQALQQQNTQSQQNLSQLQVQAGSYQAAISQLDAQISGLVQQIQVNQDTQVSLQQQIQQSQADLEKQKQILSADIKAMYVDGQMTVVEELATSKNLSDFVNAETYRNAVQGEVQNTLKTIADLQNQLEAQQQAVAAALQALQSQQAQLASAQSEQNNLLGMNQQQQTAYDAQIQSNKTQITAIQAKIAALNTPPDSDITARGVCGGGYPTSSSGPYGNWGCSYGQDNTLDNWGMYNRECVSYTAFMVHEEYLEGKVAHDMPNWGGVGNAYQWINDAESAGIPVDQTPQPGDIAIRPASGLSGDVGHAMYVESVGTLNDQPAIYVQQYNADLRGDYSEGWRSSAGLYFLHFSEWQ